MTEAPDGGLFRPPAPVPAERDRPLRRLRAIPRQIEAWPKAVFEQPVYRPPLPGLPVFLMEPTAIRTVLVEQADAFPHGALWRRVMRPMWGEGIAVAEGAEWRWQRRAAATAFRPAQMAALTPFMTRAAEAALARWRSAGPEARVDMVEESARITFDVILDTVLSGGEDFDRPTLRARIAAFMAHVARMPLSYFFAPDAWHANRSSPTSAEADRLRQEVGRMVRRRRETQPQGDLVDLLLRARDPESGRTMDEATARDNLLGFILAGHDTSAVALAWSLYLVSAHPPTAGRLRAEALAVAGGRAIAPDDVERLVFTRQVIQEAMRLYPPAYQLTRVCARTIDVAGVTIRAGTRIVVPVYALHRPRAWWRDPDDFDPDWFAPGKPAPDRCLYIPFGAGPRVCLGAAFAMTELVVVLATLARDAGFRVAPGHRVWPAAQFTLRPEGGLPMIVTVGD